MPLYYLTSMNIMWITGDGMFQIQLKNADICQPWYKSAHVSNFHSKVRY